MSKTKKAFVVRDFRDEGIETEFTANDIVEIAEGAFVNYKAAGLVRAPTEAELRPAPTKPAV